MAEDSKRSPGLAIVVIVLLMIPGILCWGFCLSRLWAWFVVPLGVSSISLWHAYGLSLVAHLLSSPTRDRGLDALGNIDFVSEAIMMKLVAPWLFLGIGYLVVVLGGVR